MKRFFVIECDTEYNSIWVHEVGKEFTAEKDDNRGVQYFRSPSQQPLICEFPGPKFYGQLDTLLITKNKLEQAEAIVPEYDGKLISGLTKTIITAEQAADAKRGTYGFSDAQHNDHLERQGDCMGDGRE